MAVALKDIAEQANLSVATVSRALRGRREISLKTRMLVQEIAGQLRYRPNELARSILSGRTGNIGVIFPKETVGAEFCMNILLGIHNELGDMGLHAICLWSESHDRQASDDILVSHIHSLLDKRVEGFIINPAIDARETYIREILERHIPMVTVDMDLMGAHCDFVGTDDFLGGYKAAEYLIQLGHSRIVHICGAKTSSTATKRKEGFLKAIADYANTEAVLIEDPFFGVDLQVTFDIAQRTLRLAPRPTAVFCANDYIASMIYKAARREGLSIPQDLAVIGFADMEISRLLDPPLTTVRQNPYQIGVSAAKILAKRVSGKNDLLEPHRVMLRPELIIRESAGIRPTQS